MALGAMMFNSKIQRILDRADQFRTAQTSVEKPMASPEKVASLRARLAQLSNKKV